MPTVKNVNTSLRNPPLTGGANPVPLADPVHRERPRDSFGVAEINPTAVGNAVSNLGTGVLRIAESVRRFQHRRDTVEAEEALVAFEREKNDLFYNPETGYFNKRGREAFDGAEGINSQLEEVRQRYIDELSNNQSREMFGRSTESQITSARREVARFSSDQFRAWENSTMLSRVENSLENAAYHWADPDQLAVQLEIGRQSVIDASTTSGDSAEAIAEKLQTFNSQFAANIINAAMVNSSTAGQKALGDYGQMLEGDELVRIQNNLDRQLEREKNQAVATAAVQQATSLVQDYGGEDNARSMIIDEVNKIEDPEIRDRTLQESMYRLNLRQQADAERRGAAFENAEQHLLEGGSIEQWISENPEAWDELDASQKSNLRKGPTTVTNYSVLSELMLMPPNELSKINPADYFEYLAPSDRIRVINAVKSARGGGFESQLERSAASQMNYAVEELFGKRDSWNDEERAQVDTFYSMIMAEEQARKNDKGSDLTPDEYTQLINDFSRRAVIQRNLGGIDWLMPDRKVDITEIPMSDYQTLSDDLRRRNIPVTSQNLLMLYEQVRIDE
jgi:hypothetical protein